MVDNLVLGDLRLLMTTLAAHMRDRGLTQERAAVALGVSTPTLKRWLAGEGISLESVLRMISMLDVSWQDLAAVMMAQSTQTFTYTRKQELHFVRYPSALAVFDLLLQGETPAKILRASGVGAPSLNRYLADLEKLGLINRGLRGQVSTLPKGEPKWIDGGPLQQSFKKEALASFLSEDVKPAESFGIYQLLSEDVADVQARLAELKQRISFLHRKAKFHGAKSKNSFGLFIKFAPFSWKRLNVVEEI